MRTKFGVLLIVLGSVLVAAALGLLFYNEQEQLQAGNAVDTLMPQIVGQIQQRQEEPQPDGPDAPEVIIPDPKLRQMPVAEIDGNEYVGFIGLPTLQKELPVMADWSDEQLKIAPCRFYGTTYADNLVIMAHNYSYHFGSLKKLAVGDIVTFTDMDGVTTQYAVVALDVLDPNAVEDMTSGDYDLTLFTCTYGGQNRVTVRCDRVEEASVYEISLQ